MGFGWGKLLNKHWQRIFILAVVSLIFQVTDTTVVSVITSFSMTPEKVDLRVWTELKTIKSWI